MKKVSTVYATWGFEVHIQPIHCRTSCCFDCAISRKSARGLWHKMSASLKKSNTYGKCFLLHPCFLGDDSSIILVTIGSGYWIVVTYEWWKILYRTRGYWFYVGCTVCLRSWCSYATLRNIQHIKHYIM